jgi:hypothetical protein
VHGSDREVFCGYDGGEFPCLGCLGCRADGGVSGLLPALDPPALWDKWRIEKRLGTTFPGADWIRCRREMPPTTHAAVVGERGPKPALRVWGFQLLDGGTKLSSMSWPAVGV